MSAPPARISPSSAVEHLVGLLARAARVGRDHQRDRRRRAWIASTYARESRNASRSHTVQRACSSAVQMPMTRPRHVIRLPGPAHRMPPMPATLPDARDRRAAPRRVQRRRAADRARTARTA